MKFLLINGSPHRGNTWKLAELAKSDLLSTDVSISFEEIHLSELNLPFCCGCSNCFRLGIEQCPHYRIISKIIDGIDRADGLIICSSTFNMRETALLKNLFDHFCSMLHRPHFFTGKALVLTTTGGVGAKSTAKSVSASLKGIGFNRCYQFSTASFSWNDYTPAKKTQTDLSKITHKFYKDVLSKKLHSPSCRLLIPYNLFRGMSLSYVKGTEYETEDGVYWTAEYRRNFVYDRSVKIPFYKKPIGYLFYAIGKTGGKMRMVTYKK